MATLLSIPEELRDQILETLILSHRPTPTIQSFPLPLHQPPPSLPRSSVRSWWTNSVLHETHIPAPTATPLLLTNRVLHAQTRRVLARLYPHGPIYTLDVLFVNERLLIPTWLHVPAFARHVYRVDVTFRIHGTSHDDMDGHGYVGFRAGDGAPPALKWAFYFLLEHFLDHGPVAPHADQRPQSGPTAGLTVHEIRLNFVSSGPCQDDTPDSRHFWHSRHGRGHNCDAPLPCLPMHPSWLAKFVHGSLPAVLGMSYHTSPYADIVLERVDLFTFVSPGVAEYRVPRYLARARVRIVPTPGAAGPEVSGGWYTDATFGYLDPGCRVLTFWNWKFRALERRRARGLEGVEEEEQVVWPTLEELERVRRNRRRVWWDGSEAGEKGKMMRCDGEGARCLCAETRLEEWLQAREAAGA
ncbi:hypothetical protein M433DRAFT_2548 [Acidomyces richmondensis BFW]|nr:MAG: hypothetical protein FE78DRAFT_67839 [Acidomyces sp. 'richmondensis']KYG47762.1 hypothetical protein M433DRAFT_2548 [Acidomyces richmondensis BFW]